MSARKLDIDLDIHFLKRWQARVYFKHPERKAVSDFIYCLRTIQVEELTINKDAIIAFINDIVEGHTKQPIELIELKDLHNTISAFLQRLTSVSCFPTNLSNKFEEQYCRHTPFEDIMQDYDSQIEDLKELRTYLKELDIELLIKRSE